MINFKKFITMFLSGLLCVAMVGCSNNAEQNKTPETAKNASTTEQLTDAEVRAEFEKVLEAYKETTYKVYEDNLEVSDPSILLETYKEYYGDNIKSFNNKGTAICEIKRDASNKVTDRRDLKSISTITITHNDGTSKVTKMYDPGDGYRYTDKDGAKIKSPYTFGNYRSAAHDNLNMDYIETLTMTKEGDKKTFKFNYKANRLIDRLFGGAYLLRKDSDIEIKDFSSTLTIDEKNNTFKETMNAEYFDKKTGVTAKFTKKYNYSTINQELPFPNDLDTYQMKE